MTTREMVKTYLLANGFDGLCNDDCGCGFDDFMPCDGSVQDCKAAYKWECDKCPKSDSGLVCKTYGDPLDYPIGCYREEKQ